MWKTMKSIKKLTQRKPRSREPAKVLSVMNEHQQGYTNFIFSFNDRTSLELGFNDGDILQMVEGGDFQAEMKAAITGKVDEIVKQKEHRVALMDFLESEALIKALVNKEDIKGL